MINTTDALLKNRFAGGQSRLDDLLPPLLELVENSRSMVVGYGIAQAGVREQMIPYFHVCGAASGKEPLRVLLLGGWSGTEVVAPFAIARILVAMEAKAALAEGLEITAYPVANLDAHRAEVFLTEKQILHGVRCWQNSPCSHVVVIEKELRRYDYDAVLLVRERFTESVPIAEAWLPEDERIGVLSDCLKSFSAADADFHWAVNPTDPKFERSFTPIPDSEKQPAEITVSLPSARSTDEQTDQAMAIIFSLLHGMRDARLKQLL